jgi:hypothetical protein
MSTASASVAAPSVVPMDSAGAPPIVRFAMGTSARADISQMPLREASLLVFNEASKRLGSELSGGAADPIRQGRAIELDPLASVDLALPIERQVVGILADQDMGNQGLRGEPALDQPRRLRRR